MLLSQLVDVADKLYPSNLIRKAYRGEETGDALAHLVAQALAYTYEPSVSDIENTRQAVKALGNAIELLEEVCFKLRGYTALMAGYRKDGARCN